MTAAEVGPAGSERFSAIPGAAELGWVPVAPTAELLERRAAVAELGAQLRRLRAATASAEHSAEALRQAATSLSAATELLESGPRRARFEPPEVDDLAIGLRMYNPVWGAGSPLAPPLEIEVRSDHVVGRCTLDLSYEGPPAYAHGGVSAMLLDQLLAGAVVAAGFPSVTRRLDLDYRRPVPVQTPLEVRSTGLHQEGSRIVATGEIVAGDEVRVRAQGWFVQLGPEQARRFLPGRSRRE